MSLQNNGNENFENNKAEAELSREEKEASAYYCATDKDSKTYKKYNKRKHRHKRKLTTSQKVKKALLIICSVLLAVVIVAVGTFFTMRQIGKNKLLNYDNVKVTAVDGANVDGDNTVEYKGKKYTLNKNIISILCMGVDKTIEENSTYGTNGQSDAVFVLTVDVSNGETNIIPINRDTVVDVNTYSESGEFAGVEKTQLCLAYSYGDGEKKSCENVAESVSRLLYGVPVNAYFAMDLDAVEVINDICGGVSVTSNETFSYLGAYIKNGQNTILSDAQARAFVRYRNQYKDNSNVKRMQRQKMFLSSAISKLGQKVKGNISSVGNIYSRLSPYSYTNIDLSQATFLASKVVTLNNSMKVNYRSVKGKVTTGGKYVKFIPNEEKLFELVLDVYYKGV